MLVGIGPLFPAARKIFLERWNFPNTQNFNEKEKNMNNQNRVLNRQGARDLNPEEVEQVSGGFVHTNVITWGPTGRDGDGLLES